MEGTYFVQFQADKAGDEGSRRGNGWDNLTRNLLGSVSIGRVDIVVHSPQIRCRGDEVDVEVGVVVFLELNWCETISYQ